MTVQTPVPLALPGLTRAQAQALRTVVQGAQGLTFSWSGTTWQLALRPRPVQGPQPAGPGEWLVGLSWSGLPFDLVVPQTAALTWLRARFPDLDIPALPQPFVTAVVESACDALAAALQDGDHDPVRLEVWAPEGGAGRSLPHALSLELRSRDLVLRAESSTSTQGLLFLAERVQAREPASNGLELSQLPMTLAVAIGMTWLGLDDLARLRPHDTILFDVCFLDEDGQLWVSQGDRGFRAQRDGLKLTVTEQFMERGWVVPAEDENGAPGAELRALDQLPLRVVFDLGELSMTLGELQSLQVGQPLPLSRPLSSAVCLRVNGALIGTGELVEIEGELGVTVTSVFQRTASRSARGARSGARARPRSAPETPQEIVP